MVGKLASVRRSVSGAAGICSFSWEPAEPASQMLPTATAINAAHRNLVDDIILNSSPLDKICPRWPARRCEKGTFILLVVSAKPQAARQRGEKEECPLFPPVEP